MILQSFTLQIHFPAPLTGYRKDAILKIKLLLPFLQNDTRAAVWPSCAMVSAVSQLCCLMLHLTTETTVLNPAFRLAVALLKAAVTLILMNGLDATLWP